MATLVIPNVAQIAIEAGTSGQKIMNIIHVQYAGLFDPVACLGAVKTAWEKTNGPMANHSNTYAMVGYTVTDLGSPTGLKGFLASTGIGQITDAPATLAAAAVIKIGANSRSRSTQGRMYHGPLTESQVAPDGRTLLGTSQTALTNAYATFRTDLTNATYPWVVASRKNSSASVITAAQAQSVIGTQRRRLR